jgi:hypothetical protein
MSMKERSLKSNLLIGFGLATGVDTYPVRNIFSAPAMSMYTIFGNSAYACPAGQDGRTFLTGARNFRAAEVEVFQVGQ